MKVFVVCDNAGGMIPQATSITAWGATRAYYERERMITPRRLNIDEFWAEKEREGYSVREAWVTLTLVG